MIWNNAECDYFLEKVDRMNEEEVLATIRSLNLAIRKTFAEMGVVK
jgi:hypothetical protein